jgi:hypothetical protein
MQLPGVAQSDLPDYETFFKKESPRAASLA